MEEIDAIILTEYPDKRVFIKEPQFDAGLAETDFLASSVLEDLLDLDGRKDFFFYEELADSFHTELFRKSA